MSWLKIIALAALLLPSLHGQAQPPGADSLLQFITQNKNRSAVCIARNDTIIARLNENKLMPLASTVKMLIAVEFAKQAGTGVIDEEALVPLSELDKYYLAGTDGGAHPAWLQYEKQKNNIKNDSISLKNIARGMIIFSSNANTEYLLDLLGLDNTSSNTQLFGLKKHTALYPIVSSFFLYQNPHKAKEDKILKSIAALTEEQYCKTIYQIHKALKYDTVLKKKFRMEEMSMKLQKTWSDRLTASTAAEYVQLCSILNRRKFLTSDSYGVLAEVLEFVMENPANQKIYKHLGIKNGSTAFVLTEAFYATLQDGSRIEAAYFFNNLTPEENTRMQRWLNDLRRGITQHPAFLTQVSKQLQ
ncbi:MAG TPA: serine hydrolase [Ferruginibacter sp.]|nr:serine hydrolase [Ferruginibacter sp.]HMP22203.1 serine hydrolase [Ferruginibacter sp.]